MATAYDPNVTLIDEVSLRAVTGDKGDRRGSFATIITGLSGIFLIVFPCLIWGAEELTEGLFTLMVLMGVLIVLAAIWEVRDQRSR
jgi:hypothetical protein